MASNYHIEMNPSDAGNNDRLVVQEVLKEIAQYHLADANSKRQFKGITFRRNPWSHLDHLLNASVLQSCFSWKWIV